MKFAPQKTKLYECQMFFSPHKQLKVIIQLCGSEPVHILTEDCAIHVTKIQAPYG